MPTATINKYKLSCDAHYSIILLALSLEPNEQYKQNFATDLHISGAVLDVESLSANSKKGVQVWVEYESKQHLITNLGRQTPQFTLDIGFSKGERVTFFTKGPGNVHLHGYFVPDDDVENEKLYDKYTIC